MAQFGQNIFYCIIFKIVPIIEAYFDRYVLSKVGIICNFVYIVTCVCVFVTLLAGGNKEIYLSYVCAGPRKQFREAKTVFFLFYHSALIILFLYDDTLQ